MEGLQVFTFNGSSVRTVLINDEPYFVGKDVAAILGYRNTRDALKYHVEDSDKGVANFDTLGGTQELTVINDSGLYSLALGSKLPEARRFKHWVTSEVLPSLQKHGMYAKDELLDNPELAIEVFTKLKEERDRRRELELTVASQSRQIEEAKPKVTYYDIVLQSKDCIATNVIAKDFGKSAIWLNRYLAEKGVQYKQGRVWLLYQTYADEGYTATKTFASPATDGYVHSHVKTYWTQKGRLFIYNLLKKDGYLPAIEKGKAPVRSVLAYTEVDDMGVSE